MHSYAIRLKFKASNYVMDYEALLAGLAASANQGIKDLHVFIDSLTLVAQVEGIHTPTIEHERKYKEEILDATAPFHRQSRALIGWVQSYDDSWDEIKWIEDAPPSGSFCLAL
ncbi:reverse transcriptase domain-containing protein [Tanacetum coccineum]